MIQKKQKKITYEEIKEAASQSSTTLKPSDLLKLISAPTKKDFINELKKIKQDGAESRA